MRRRRRGMLTTYRPSLGFLEQIMTYIAMPFTTWASLQLLIVSEGGSSS